MSNQMWLPKTETKVTVTQDGTVNVWDEMTMELRPIPRTGFGPPKDWTYRREPDDHSTMGTPPPQHPPA